LPEIDVVEGCRYSCDPADPGSRCEECRERRKAGTLPKEKRRPRVVDLPVSATEDRLVGTLHLEHALKHGERVFEPGLLADANRGILYVDEVNLLDDHLVDTLLDAAAMAVNTVEREGVSFVHPARFILVGTMNPEEGEVRPQLLDRFGLCVEVEGIADPAQRVEIVKRRHAFESDPGAFARRFADEEAGLELLLKHSRVRLPSVPPSDEVLGLIAEICSRLGVDGHRADLTMARAAAAAAALDGRSEASIADVREVAPLVLAHRMRRAPFEDAAYDHETVESVIASASPGSGEGDPPPPASENGGPADGDGATVIAIGSAEDAGPGAEPVSARLAAPLDRTRRAHSGKRQETTSDDGRGRYVRAEPAKAGAPVDLALDATIRAAAPFQAGREGEMAVRIEPQDIRTKVRKRRVGASIVFCVDASGSMGAASRMETAKAAVLELLVEAYQRRDRVGVVSFRGEDAEVLLPPTQSVELAQLKLRSMPTGGATPLAHGIVSSLELLEGEVRRNADTVPWLVLVTDGRANVGIRGGLGSEDARAAATRVKASAVHALVIDTDSAVLGGAARDLARAAGAEYVRLGHFDGASVAGAVRERLEAI
ncbi:MAG: VWA domain-containing protein, partial [Actinobacteria bacterium]